MQLYTPTTSYPEVDINRFYTIVAETLRKLNHNMIVIGDVNAQIRKKYKIMYTVIQKKALTWTSPKGVTKAEIDYILTSSQGIVTDVTGINQVNTKSRCHTNKIKEDRIPLRIEKTVQDTTRTRRHRHHE